MASTKNFSSGYREIGYRFELLDKDLNIVRDVTDKVKEATIENNSFVSVNRTAKFTIKEDYTQPATILSDYRDTYNQSTVSVPFDGWTKNNMENFGGVLTTLTKQKYSGDSPEFTDGSRTTTNTSGITTTDGTYPNGFVMNVLNTAKTDFKVQFYPTGGINGASVKFIKNSSLSTNHALMETNSGTPLPTSGAKRIYFCGFYRSDSLESDPDVVMKLTGGGNPSKYVQVNPSNINNTVVSGSSIPLAQRWYFFEGYHDLVPDGTYTSCSPTIGIYQGPNGKSIEYDQFYYDASKSSAYVLDSVATSPVINCSVADALGMANQLKTSLCNLTETRRVSPRSSGTGVTTRPNIIEINWSRDGGSTWLGWTTNTISLVNGWDMRNFRFQLRYTLGEYTQYPYGIEYSYPYLSDFQVGFGGSTNIANPNYDVIDYTKHRIKPYLQINNNGTWTDYPLGIFLLNSAKRQDNEGGITREVDGYDQLVILSQAKLVSDLTFYPWSQSLSGAGQVGGWARTVKGILLDTYREIDVESEYYRAGMEFLASNINIPNDVYSGNPSRGRNFKAGTTWLEVINTLLRAGNYTGLYCDSNGKLTSNPYVSPDLIPAKHTYRDDEMSIIFTEASEELDSFETANVFVAVQKTDYEGEELISRYFNENYGHPSSIPSQGRFIVDYREADNMESQAELDNYLYRIAYEASQVYGQIHFNTALDPTHEDLDNVYLRYQDLKIDGMYTETAWTMHLTEDPYMEHRLRRIVSI